MWVSAGTWPSVTRPVPSPPQANAGNVSGSGVAPAGRTASIFTTRLTPSVAAAGSQTGHRPAHSAGCVTSYASRYVWRPGFRN
jgi:hypothetical protein